MKNPYLTANLCQIVSAKMKDKWLVTLEIDTYDGDPRHWDWDTLSTGEDKIKIINSEFKGRVLPDAE